MVNNKPKSIREFAASINFRVVGKLTRVAGSKNSDGVKMPPYWLDEDGNEYMGNAREGFSIITADGGVI